MGRHSFAPSDDGPEMCSHARSSWAATSLVFSIALAAFPNGARADTCDAAAPSLPARPRMRDLVPALADRIDACATSARAKEGARFWAKHGLEPTPTRMRDYTRMWTLFELTRDGGPFRLRWAVTNEEPSAKKVWAAWRTAPPPVNASKASATAECDEISSVFAHLATKMGVKNVGLFWPRWNHTIAAWEPAPHVRVLVPTTQIFVGCDDTFDRVAFDPKVQKTVFPFPPWDISDDLELPPALASFLVTQTTAYAGASTEVLAAIRVHRAVKLGSSVPASCSAGALAAVARLRAEGPLRAEDHRAFARYGAELGLEDSTPPAVLAVMAR